MKSKNQIELFLMAIKECGYKTIKQVEGNMDKVMYLVDVFSKMPVWELEDLEHRNNIVTAAQIISSNTGLRVDGLIVWAGTHGIDLAYSGHILSNKENRLLLLEDVLSNTCKIKELIK